MHHQKKKEILPAVAAAIFNSQGQILLQKRGDVNQWCIVSGHVEYGETVEEAILREVLEETGARARVLRLIGVYSSPVSQTYHYADKSVQYVTSYFEVELLDPLDPYFSSGETRVLEFFPKDALPGQMALISAHWLSDALTKGSGAFMR